VALFPRFRERRFRVCDLRIIDERRVGALVAARRLRPAHRLRGLAL
jgi:hypothetical protein